jgi:glycosyltransferase involved in cell wall biosynthesis
MVLAYNEERHIVACLDSIFAADPDAAFEVYVMANGCTDRTEELVREYGRKRPEVHLVSIALGDKCNAWNVFIHETVPARCPGREVYFFMDGDATVLPGSFSAMARALRDEPHAHAASAAPASGRNIEHDRAELLAQRGLVANLYALRGAFVERLRALCVRIPLGLEGDDGLIGALIKWDLAPERQGFDHRRIVPCAVRYGRRHYEFRLLGAVLKARGISGLPVHIDELYGEAQSLPLKWQGLYTLPNLVALRRMRRIGRERAAGLSGAGRGVAAR